MCRFLNNSSVPNPLIKSVQGIFSGCKQRWAHLAFFKIKTSQISLSGYSDVGNMETNVEQKQNSV